MIKQPLFSVLIANYNNGKYLMEAIKSVRQQTYTNWEIVLVDDGSTDNSEELYAELEKDERIHIYHNEQNMGCGYTKRRCAELTKGEICGFLDPDDTLTPDALDVMIEAHAEHPEASLIYSCHFIADENLQNRRIQKWKAIETNKTYLEVNEGGPTAFAAFKTNAYRETIGIDAKFKRAVDQDLYLKLEETGELVFVDKPLYVYRQGTGGNISLGTRNARKALCWDMIAKVDACKRRNMSIDQYAFSHILHELEAVENQAAWEKEKEIRSSKTYRVGRVIMKPIKELKKFFKKIRQ